MRHNPKTLSLFQKRNIHSMRDFSKEEILSILDFAKTVEENPQDYSLSGKLMASCFFEPSTRTRLSFEAAIKKLGGDAIGFSEASSTSISKKETLFDTIKVIGQYSDVIVIRHPLEGASRLAAMATDKPVINAGDGANQHPTQTLLDLYSMRESQGQLENLHIAFSGDLKYARTVHSLVQAASHFNMRMYFVSPAGLELPKQITDELKQRGVLFSFHPTLSSILPKLDILYMTRIQEERMPRETMPMDIKNCSICLSMLDRVKPTFKILHPLPRVKEIDIQIDQTPYAFYFEQARHGIYVRQALLITILTGND